MRSNIKTNFSVSRIIVTLIMLCIVIVGGTFAWFSYRSKETALVLSIGDINDSKIIINPYEIRESLMPVNIYTSGVYSQVQVINNSSNEMDFQLFYRINNLDEDIIDSGLKYTIVSSDVIDGLYEEVKTGDFLSIGEENEYVIYDDVVSSSTTIYYKVYVWLDSSVGNQSVIRKMELDIELNASGTIINAFPVESYSCANGSVGSEPYVISYTGDCEVIDDGDDNWRVKFLTDGTLTSSLNMPIDAFLVGGGGGGGTGGGGGGGGLTNTTFVNIKEGMSYVIDIGNGGSSNSSGKDTTAFNAIANGGSSGGSEVHDNGDVAGSGGSGGGGEGANGGSDGSAGDTENTAGGSGQERTTREFGEETGDLYAGGGGGTNGLGGSGGGANGGFSENGDSANANTGGGGGGSYNYDYSGGSGGSGIVVIRNHKNTSSISNLPSVGFDFTYTGKYLIINDGDDNWRIKFLTSGTFVSSKDLYIDAFLVGGGGGGGYYGGGGGGVTNTTFVSVKKDVEYKIFIGAGGAANSSGKNTAAFGAIANGGGGGGTDEADASGGSGGSGGGGDGANGGSDGSTGSNDYSSGGSGQERTTREFGEETGDLYGGGGGGGQGAGGLGGGAQGGYSSDGTAAIANTGGGGGGAGWNNDDGGTGASGIVVIRNHRNTSSVSNLPSVGFDFTYTGNYVIINDGNGDWRIKFLTSGTFNSSSDLSVDAFLVGGGGGGGSYGGGGGGQTLTSSVSIAANTDYGLVIGAGGSSDTSGESTTAFSQTANGGGAGSADESSGGGDGGSGGGGYCGGGGSDGTNGESADTAGGVGQGITTREFGEVDTMLYAGGGGGGESFGGAGGGAPGGVSCNGVSAVVNTGGGGGGAGSGDSGGGTGGSGVVIIRNKR